MAFLPGIFGKDPAAQLLLLLLLQHLHKQQQLLVVALAPQLNNRLQLIQLLTQLPCLALLVLLLRAAHRIRWTVS